jgi:hypothetical protein
LVEGEIEDLFYAPFPDHKKIMGRDIYTAKYHCGDFINRSGDIYITSQY